MKLSTNYCLDSIDKNGGKIQFFGRLGWERKAKEETRSDDTRIIEDSSECYNQIFRNDLMTIELKARRRKRSSIRKMAVIWTRNVFFYWSLQLWSHKFKKRFFFFHFFHQLFSSCLEMLSLKNID